VAKPNDGIYVNLDTRGVWLVIDGNSFYCFSQGGWIPDSVDAAWKRSNKKLLSMEQLRDALFNLAKQEENAA
jgi:hypothetical protein